MVLPSPCDQGCAAGFYVAGVNPDGTLSCIADEDTTYSAADFVVSGEQCLVTEKFIGTDALGNFICLNDANTTYSGVDFATSDQTCAPGELVEGVDASGALICVVDVNTTYSGADFALSDQGCDPSEKSPGSMRPALLFVKRISIPITRLAQVFNSQPIVLASATQQ